MNISFQHIRTVGDFKYRSAFLSLLVTPAVSLLINQSKRVSDLSNSAKMELDELQKKPPNKFVFFFFLFVFMYFGWARLPGWVCKGQIRNC